jgi:glycyl-tRNA synthetase beta chain
MNGEVFVEVRCEELPASMVRPALAALEAGVRGLLDGVSCGASRVWATPRRLAVAISDVDEGRPLTRRTVTGPPADRAFDADGSPTKAGAGFARGKGVGASALHVVDGPRGPVAAVVVEEGGERTEALLGAGIGAVVLGLPFRKAMEWGEGGVRFGRPLHGVAVLFGGQPVSGEVAGLAFAPRTRAHRFAEAPWVEFDSAESWLAGVRAQGVEPDLAVREAMIRSILEEVAVDLGADPIEDDALVEEVLHLVEFPVRVVGSFEDDLLALPERLLVKSMKSHTQSFPISREGALTSSFVAISNNPWGDEATIAAGYARVLRARFYDARFFFAEDRRQPLAAHAGGLERMQWMRGVGSMADKAARLEGLAGELAVVTGADPATASRAGALCKLDLTTQMVGEFPDLQGHMGRLYAAESGEPEAVAMAIEEHYQPASADGAVPASAVGAAVALADRLDTLAGCFGVGIIPSGSGDPQGLRRAAQGVLRIAIEHELRLDLVKWFRAAVRRVHAQSLQTPERFGTWQDKRGTHSAPAAEDELVAQLVAFTTSRLPAVVPTISADLVDAVTSATQADPLVLHRKLSALAEVSGTEDFGPIMVTFKRALNITRDSDDPAPLAKDLGEPAEHALHDALVSAEEQLDGAEAALDYRAALSVVLSLQTPVAAFFDAVLVDAPEPAVRAVRRGLVRRAAALFLRVADFSRVSTR